MIILRQLKEAQKLLGTFCGVFRATFRSVKNSSEKRRKKGSAENGAAFLETSATAWPLKRYLFRRQGSAHPGGASPGL